MTISFKNWHFMRLLRAGFACWIFSEAWRTGAWILLLPGGIFALQAIFDIGCCGAAGCAVPQQGSQSAKTVEYEEVR